MDFDWLGDLYRQRPDEYRGLCARHQGVITIAHAIKLRGLPAVLPSTGCLSGQGGSGKTRRIPLLWTVDFCFFQTARVIVLSAAIINLVLPGRLSYSKNGYEK
jgi:hypothetical protein